ncbi:hypothetical protein COOONC_01462 [Cooperia oncophora]
MANRVVATLPRIRATIGHIPQRLKTANIEPSSRARLELIQLGVERGEHDEYTTEMMEWWLLEEDLITKMHKVIVPRFANREGPFTSIYRLPTQRLQQFVRGRIERWKRYDIAVLEIDGNPFPPVLGEKPDNSSSLLNILLRDSLQNRLHKLQTKLKD